MELTKLKEYAEFANSILTSLSIIIGGIWIYYRFIRQQENYPNINFSVDLKVIGKQDTYWIVELIAIIDNKGKVQHKINRFDFDLNALFSDDKIETKEEWGNQVNFPHELISGSFLPKSTAFFFVDPATIAKYSFVTKVPENTQFLILHSNFMYDKRKKYGHAAEKTIHLQ